MTEPEDSLVERAVAHARRRARRSHGTRSFWHDVSHVGALGWIIALPLAGFALLGHVLYLRLGSGVRWSLSGLGLGLVISAYSLWRTLRAEAQREEDERRVEEKT